MEINGGLVKHNSSWRLTLPAIDKGYANAQIDDYGVTGRQNGRSSYPWSPNIRLQLHARFSHNAQQLHGTAGFGFWNAPFGDPTVRWPALPQAAWFFFGSPPTNLPLAPNGPGQGWFAATLDATTPRAWSMAPFAPVVVLFNRWSRFRQRVWPYIQQRLGVSYQQLPPNIDSWHDYELVWQEKGCRFLIDDELVLQTAQSPKGPLGFVCWIDNQYMVLENNGRFRWGILPTPQAQQLEVKHLQITSAA